MKLTGCYLLVLGFAAAASAFDLIFRDQVEKKGTYRPAGQNDYQQGAGYYLDKPQNHYYPTYDDDTYDKPTYPPLLSADDYDTNYPSHPDYHRPSYQDNYKPAYEDDYKKPIYQNDYEPSYPSQGYKPNYQDDYYDPPFPQDFKPPFHQDGYKPAYKPINYDEDHYDKKPLYEDTYKPNYEDEYNKPSYEEYYNDDKKPTFLNDFKPPYEDEYVNKPPTATDDVKPPYTVFDRPTYEEEFDERFKPPTFGPIDFELSYVKDPNYDNDNHQDKPTGYGKPAAYEPAPPKPYKPKPEYPKQVVLLTPSAALKSSSYAHEHTTKDYHPGASVAGTAGKDYPNYKAVPSTSFDCLSVKHSDYSYMFADTETGCQVFHSCHSDGRQDSFLCPTGTIFDSNAQTCDWWYNVRCY